jgi:hypothetical protein
VKVYFFAHPFHLRQGESKELTAARLTCMVSEPCSPASLIEFHVQPGLVGLPRLRSCRSEPAPPPALTEIQPATIFCSRPLCCALTCVGETRMRIPRVISATSSRWGLPSLHSILRRWRRLNACPTAGQEIDPMCDVRRGLSRLGQMRLNGVHCKLQPARVRSHGASNS